MSNIKKELCPFDNVLPFECDIYYRLKEFERQMEVALNKGVTKYFLISKDIECQCDPEMCSRYVNHIVNNLEKYKQNGKTR